MNQPDLTSHSAMDYSRPCLVLVLASLIALLVSLSAGGQAAVAYASEAGTFLLTVSFNPRTRPTR